jgi:TonB family protein
VQATLLGRVPTKELPSIRGFEILPDGNPVIAVPHGLITFRQQKVIQTDIVDEIKSIAVDDKGALIVETMPVSASNQRLFKRIEGKRLAEDPRFTIGPEATLFNSGNAAFLTITSSSESVRFAARNRSGDVLPLAKAEGRLRAVSWNRAGLAAVVDSTLLVWQSGGTELTRLAVDSGLSGAIDSCLIDSNRAVVSLQNWVVLVSQKGTSAIVGIRARCRYAQGTLYLLDERDGLVWALRGIERVGGRESDVEHARNLIKQNPANATESSSRYLEAARIVGCDEARLIRDEALRNRSISANASRAGEPEPSYELSEPGISPPRRLSPPPTSEPRDGGIQLSVIVGADGAVRSAEVLRSFAPDSNTTVLNAVRQWRFEPGRKDGRPVAVRIETVVPIEMGFSIIENPGRSSAPAYLNSGLGLIRAGKYDEAVQAFDQAIAADPKLSEAYYQKGLALVATSATGPDGRVLVRPGALESLRKYLELSPSGEHATSVRAMIQSLERR